MRNERTDNKMSTDWTILLFSLCLLDGVISCDPDPNSVWKEYKPIERMLMSQIVVYGKDLNNADELTSSVGNTCEKAVKMDCGCAA